MPSITTHQPIAVGSGVVTAFACSYRQPLPERLIETLGGALGGWATGMLADKLDPPDHPRHRGIGHAIIPNALAVSGYAQCASKWQEALRSRADEYETAASQTPPGTLRIWFSLLAFLCRLGVGAIAGAVGGHWSHLILDSHTAYGLPLLFQGC
jgi:hypothetical protein